MSSYGLSSSYGDNNNLHHVMIMMMMMVHLVWEKVKPSSSHGISPTCARSKSQRGDSQNGNKSSPSLRIWIIPLLVVHQSQHPVINCPPIIGRHSKTIRKLEITKKRNVQYCIAAMVTNIHNNISPLRRQDTYLGRCFRNGKIVIIHVNHQKRNGTEPERVRANNLI